MSLRCLVSAPNASYGWHSHPFEEITFVSDDSATIGYPPGKMAVGRNTLLLYHRGEQHGAWCSESQSPRFWVIHFSATAGFNARFPRFEGRDPASRFWTLSPEQVENFKWLYLQMLNERTRSPIHDPMAESSWLRLLLISVHRWVEGETATTLTPEVAHPQLLKLWHLVNSAVGQSAEYLEKIQQFPNYDSLRHAFSKAFGCSPREMLRRLRVQHAKNLLLESRLSIKEIAFRCGYQRQHEFARAFNKYTGMAPSTWRQDPLARIPTAAK